MNHSFLSGVSAMLGDVRSFLDVHSHVLDMDAKDLRAGAGRNETLQKGKGLYGKLVAGLMECEYFLDMIGKKARRRGQSLLALCPTLFMIPCQTHAIICPQ